MRKGQKVKAYRKNCNHDGKRYLLAADWIGEVQNWKCFQCGEYIYA